MRDTVAVLLLVGATCGVPAPASAAAPLQRFALVVGANYGGADRPQLQYAVSDAERFARVMVDLGGVKGGNEIVLKQPKLRELVAALDLLSGRVEEARRAAAGNGGGRTEIIVYYSGHADEKGLLLGEDRYSYRSLRDRLDQVPADVRIVVLDACASGAFTRIKGGRTRPAFIVDESSDTRGHAFLTSSAATEAAQESDRIHASYFTHYLVSGLRGGADLSADGRITLNEAYQFAFNETLGGTVDTKGGAQHPSYDINMSGTGDVVMTDVRQTSATLVLGEELDGRFFVRNAAHELVVELYKPYGRRVELGLEPGTYEVRMNRDKAAFIARAQVADGARVELEPKQFNMTAIERTRSRGNFGPADFAVAGRNQLSFRFGMSYHDPSVLLLGPTPGTKLPSPIQNGVAELQYGRYLTEDLAVTAAAQGFGVILGRDSTGSHNVFSTDAGLVGFPVGVRWSPLRLRGRSRAIRPFLEGSVGPLIGASDKGFLSTAPAARKVVTAGGRLGAGVDAHLPHSLVLGFDAGYNWMRDFKETIGTRHNYSAPGFTVSIGWIFGSGRAPRQ